MRECFQPCLIYRLAEVPLIKMFSDRDFHLNHSGGCSDFLQSMLFCPILKSHALELKVREGKLGKRLLVRLPGVSEQG
jgi:hypothetical protein